MSLIGHRGQMQHVAYKGGPAAMTNLLAGQVGVMFSDLMVTLPHIRSGKLIALAVGSSQRIPQLPDTKTIAELDYKGFEAVAWAGILAPANTPTPIVDRLSAELKEILAKKNVQELLVNAGTLPVYGALAKMGQHLNNDGQKCGKIIREKNIVPE